MYLPAVEHEAEATAEPSETIRGGSERILFVDDETILADVGREMLEGLGYEVVAVTNSTSALEIFHTQSDRFDLVITDMTMPGMTGKDLIKELLRIRPNIPTILCTGFSEFITDKEANGLGISDFLMKPISLKTLAKSIRSVLDARDA
jgi:CheY-like chemotaxis protein